MKQRLEEASTKELVTEINECEKELRVYYDLQKIFMFDFIDFVRWTDQIRFRKTFFGKVGYRLGKVIAVSYLIRLCFSAKNLVYPVYTSNKISSTVIKTLTVCGLYRKQDELFWDIIIQYLSIVVIGILIATNVRSFMRNLLKTIKNCLRDQMIQLSYNTTILVFSFIMGAYYLSTLLQLSMNLPESNQSREAFSNLLEKFSPNLIFYTFDCTFVISSFLGAALLYSNNYIK